MEEDNRRGFFNAPGIERLYSGVTNRTASTEAIATQPNVASAVAIDECPAVVEP